MKDYKKEREFREKNQHSSHRFNGNLDTYFYLIDIAGISIDVGNQQSGLKFDNIYIGKSIKEADAFKQIHFDSMRDAERKDFEELDFMM